VEVTVTIDLANLGPTPVELPDLSQPTADALLIARPPWGGDSPGPVALRWHNRSRLVRPCRPTPDPLPAAGAPLAVGRGISPTITTGIVRSPATDPRPRGCPASGAVLATRHLSPGGTDLRNQVAAPERMDADSGHGDSPHRCRR
jgi:hypothetical protein